MRFVKALGGTCVYVTLVSGVYAAVCFVTDVAATPTGLMFSWLFALTFRAVEKEKTDDRA